MITEKQKDVIKKMRNGMEVFTINGFNAKACTSNKTKISFPTLWKLAELKLIEERETDWRSTTYQLTNHGKTIKI